jgi:Spy/CpxP family protein refolding chaperone
LPSSTGNNAIKLTVFKEDMQMKKMMVLLALVMLLGATSLAVARGGMGCGMGPGMGVGPGGGMGDGMGCGMGHGGGGMMLGALDDLNLSAEQWTKVQALREAHLKEVVPIQNQLFAKKNELRLLWAQTTPDGAQILAKQKELGELQIQMRGKATQLFLEVRKLLTPEQQTKLSAMGPGMGPGMGAGKGRHRGPGAGPGQGPCCQ